MRACIIRIVPLAIYPGSLRIDPVRRKYKRVRLMAWNIHRARKKYQLNFTVSEVYYS